jgi:hypothetical protein
MLACQQSDGSRRSASLRKRGGNADQHRDDLHKVDPKFQDECFHQYLAAIDEPNKFAREHFGKRNSYQIAPLFVGLSCRASPCSAELDGEEFRPLPFRRRLPKQATTDIRCWSMSKGSFKDEIVWAHAIAGAFVLTTRVGDFDLHIG